MTPAQNSTLQPGSLRWVFYWIIRSSSWVLAKIWFRFSVQGAEKIPREGAVVLVANHASFIDPILLSICTRRWVRYLMYASFYHSFARPVFRFFMCVPVDEKRYLDALKIGGQLLESGACVGLFPEGAVSYDGRLLPAKPGALFLAQRAGAPLIPVTLVGNHAALPRGGWMPRFSRVTVIVGDPIRIDREASREVIARTLENEVMAVFAKNLGQPYPPAEPVVFPPDPLPSVRYY